ncbi:MAG: xanthine dehydrogenase family protein subunit M [Rhodospirillales bacterium]|nr:xanthine dehydrogenase family protein subunit M [Rhodospirillales bacterium]MDH3790964.1 xanthine dehydrogenase family protein subunit M [Rhodospirillales bacterium]MDH3913046.1 xanthine dehydrogenase family protein subunit M [Rhodospirillales bacterium]MDH3967532.1 xanthine dehydrogenase family protein subunit M [Rhodospirillales bacterium]
MYDFAYHRPASLEEAERLLSGASDGTLIAGGMTLIPALKQRLASPSDVIDLSGVAGLSGISEAGGAIVVGALTPHAAVASDAVVTARVPALAALAAEIGDPQVRNRGTLGGSIANNDPVADYPAAVLGLGATVRTNRREIAADDFFTGMFETALEDGEIVTAVSFPVPDKAGYTKFSNPASRYAVVGVLVSRGPAGTRVAVTGAGPCVFRSAELEQALAGDFTAAALDAVTVAAEGLNSDIHASADYRAHLVGVMAKRAVAACG